MIVYKATNKLNGMIYVGQTTLTLEERKKTHKKDACSKMSCPKFHNAINKYGIENFSFETIATAKDMDTLNDLEAYYIEWFNTIARNGYNLDSGGNHRKMHEESKLKISIANKGRVSPNKGKHHTEETKALISKANKGKPRPPFSEEHKRKIGEGHKGKKSPHSKEWCENQRIKMTGRKHSEESKRRRAEKLSKPIICLTDNKEFPSSLSAAEYYGIGSGNLAKLLKGGINYLTSKIDGKRLTFSYKLEKDR